MEYVRVTGAPDLAVAPRVFRTIAASPYVAEARLLDWNVATLPRIVALFRINGDREPLEADLAEAPEVEGLDCTRIDDDQFHALVTLDTEAVPLIRSVFEALSQLGVVVIKPVVYRDGEVHATFVGDGEALGTVVDSFPPPVDLTVHSIGTYDGGIGTGTASLSERQREALLAAIDLGYYEVPSAATHEDVADRLGCTPSTATEHLRKAERTVIGATMGAETA